MRKITGVSTIVLLFCLGCGGAEPPPAVTATEAQNGSGEQGSTGSASAEERSGSVAQPSDAPPPAEEAPAVGPAVITIDVTVKGQPVPATIQFIEQSGKTGVEGKAGEKISISSGKYEAVVQVTDPAALADKPTKRMSVEIKPGQEVKEQVSFPWAKIRLNVRVDGKLDAKAKVKLIRDGVAVATINSADKDYVQISPGRYQAEVTTRNTKATVDKLMFPEGAMQDVPVDVQFQ
jgi:hypothetical protein